MTQELDRNQCIPWTSAEIFPGWGNVQILLILYRFLRMQRKWTFIECFTLSIPWVCAGWTSIVSRLSETFSALGLVEMLFFLFVNYLISVMESQDLVSVSRHVSRLVFWSLGLEGFRSQSRALCLETLHKLFFMKFCKKEFLKKRF